MNVRDLHQSLSIKTRFDIWINRRLTDSPFKENVDFI
ncbi:antA/AntB antirepressor family protein [Rodentibacter rarus]